MDSRKKALNDIEEYLKTVEELSKLEPYTNEYYIFEKSIQAFLDNYSAGKKLKDFNKIFSFSVSLVSSDEEFMKNQKIEQYNNDLNQIKADLRQS